MPSVVKRHAPPTVHEAVASGATPEQLAQTFEGGGVQTPIVDPVALATGGMGGGLLKAVGRGAAVATPAVAKALPAVAKTGLTLSPAMPLRSGSGFVHTILDAGKEIGLMKVIPGGSKLRIDTIQGTGAGTMGVGAMKTLLKQLKAAYPEVKQITGFRTTGASPLRTAIGAVRP